MKKDKKLEIKDISISFENKKVLENVSIDLYENELVCILGVSGAGKTTLFNIIAGLLKPDCGNEWRRYNWKIWKNKLYATKRSAFTS